MFVLKGRAEWLAVFALALLMAVTRVHHFGIGTIAPDASTAVFLLAGLLLGSPWWLLAFLAEAVALDIFAIGFAGVANACVTSGYALLAPAYGALWLAGRALRPAQTLDLLTAGKFVCFTAGGTAAFFIVSNLGYYIGSDYASLSMSEYVTRVSRYFPMYLTATFFYTALGLGVYLAAQRISGRAPVIVR